MVQLEINDFAVLHFQKGDPVVDAVWHHRSNARTAELWQAFAMLCAIYPESFTQKKARSFNYIEWRLDLAVEELDRGFLEPLIKFPEEPMRSIVRFVLPLM